MWLAIAGQCLSLLVLMGIIVPVRKIVVSDLQRVRLFDCYMENEGNISFTGIIDASQMKGKIGQIVNCRIDDGDRQVAFLFTVSLLSAVFCQR
jgi:hypothetical protein